MDFSAKEIFQHAVLWVCVVSLVLMAMGWIADKTIQAAKSIGRCGVFMPFVAIACTIYGGFKFQRHLCDNGSSADDGVIAWAATNFSFAADQPIYATVSNKTTGAVATNAYAFADSPIDVGSSLAYSDVYVWWSYPGIVFMSDETVSVNGSWANMSDVCINYTVTTARPGDTIVLEARIIGSDVWSTVDSRTIPALSGQYLVPFQYACLYQFDIYTTFVPEPPVHTNGVYNVQISPTVGSNDKYISTRVPVRVDGRQIMPVTKE